MNVLDREKMVADGLLPAEMDLHVCVSCGTADRKDFIGRRMHERGYGCRQCGGIRFRDPMPMPKLQAKIAAGEFDVYEP